MKHCHEHHNCHGNHALKFCGQCNAVYCENCHEEWKPPCTAQHYPYYPNIYSIPPVCSDTYTIRMPGVAGETTSGGPECSHGN